ncbi:MAG: hypothetical protein IJV35_06890 [Neisseriaceae bacterium]|nr:hypothetical protein [Neisseriaceae bacterium]
MTASLTGLPRFELSFKSRNDTVFLLSGCLKQAFNPVCHCEIFSQKKSWQSSFANRQNKRR